MKRVMFLMASLGFILGVLLLVFASGAGASARKSLGIAVAFPQRDLHFDANLPLRVEVVPLPEKGPAQPDRHAAQSAPASGRQDGAGVAEGGQHGPDPASAP